MTTSQSATSPGSTSSSCCSPPQMRQCRLIFTILWPKMALLCEGQLLWLACNSLLHHLCLLSGLLCCEPRQRMGMTGVCVPAGEPRLIWFLAF